tara:strand:- start:153 stop:422 length:270 start_codon:yes stop_codon:yes gene_type:complete
VLGVRRSRGILSTAMIRHALFAGRLPPRDIGRLGESTGSSMMQKGIVMTHLAGRVQNYIVRRKLERRYIGKPRISGCPAIQLRGQRILS